jgi:hypothetical protein
MGFSYTRAADFPAFLRTGRFDLFSKGHRFTDKVKNMLRGQVNGAEVLIFDYYYRETTQVSHITQTTRATVACFRNPESNQPFIYHKAGLNYLAPEEFRTFLEDGMKAFKQSGVT